MSEVDCEHKISFGASWNHTKGCCAAKKSPKECDIRPLPPHPLPPLFLAGPGEARDCSTNSLVINYFIHSFIQPFPPIALQRRYAQTVRDSSSSYKIDYVIGIKNFLNPEGHQNPVNGSKVTVILVKGRIWPIGVASAVEGLQSTGLPSLVFKASALWADAFYNSKCPAICPSVCLCVCLSVCSLLRYRLTVFLPPTSQSWMSNIFRDSGSLGKSNGKKWSNIWTFLFGSGNPASRWIRDLWSKGVSLTFGMSLDVFEFLRFWWFFLFFKKVWFLGILGPPGNHASRWIRDLWSKGVSLMLAYF